MLPDNYNVPNKPGNYLKFKEGENRFRILSDPILGWVAWNDTPEGGRKPLRTPMDVPFTVNQLDDEDSVRHFWAMVVWSYDNQKVQILEITQKGIQKSLTALDRSKAWGDLKGYNILVTKSGQKLETEYTVNPEPPTKLEKEIVDAYKDTKINLEALFEGKDPFADDSEEIADSVPATI